MKVRVEFESTPIRHIAVQCPHCGRWFYGSDMTDHALSYEYDIYTASFECPVCGQAFGSENGGYGFRSNVELIECGSASEVYKGCYQKKTVWEAEEDA